MVNADDRAYLSLGLVPEAGRQLEESLVRDQVVHHLGGKATSTLAEQLDRALPRAKGIRGALPHHVARDASQGLLPANTRIEAIDAACASALYTIDAGADAILHGEADIALCGGAFATSPRYMVLFDAMRGLSRSGQLKAFDTDADGTVISDGSVVLALKSHRRAQRDGDTVFGLVLGFGGACDGRGKAINASDPRSQRLALDRALARSASKPEDIDWVLAHATGTRAGDRSEIAMLREAAPDAGWAVSANKGLVGHTGPPSGGISIVQALMGLRRGVIPAQRPATTPPGETAPLAIPQTDIPWPANPDRPRRAAVAAYGIGGANAFTVLGEPHPKSPPPEPRSIADDPTVVVAWSADLPGEPSPSDTAEWLRSGTYPWPLSYGDRYQFSGAAFRMTKRAVQTMDRTQPMTLRCVDRLAHQLGSTLADLRRKTGVIYASTGPTRAYVENTVRCYLDQLATAVDADIIDPLARNVRRSVAPTNEDSLTGGMANIPGGRAANHLDLQGLSVRCDAGRDSALAALAAARRCLRAGDLDLVLLLSANGVTTPALAEAICSGEAPAAIAEGAFGLALTRQSVARENNLTVLATLAWPDLEGTQAPSATPCQPARERSWLGADAAVDVLSAVVRGRQQLVTPVEGIGQPAVLVKPPGHASADADEAEHGEQTTAAVPSAPPRIKRHALAWTPDQGSKVSTAPVDSLPDACTVITNVRALETTGSGRCTLIPPESDGPTSPSMASVAAADFESLTRSRQQKRHVRVLIDLAAPTDQVLAAHELVFAAVRASVDDLRDNGSCVIVVFNAHDRAPSAACEGLFTAMVKSLALELPECLTVCIATDHDRPAEALALIERETSVARVLPAVRYIGGVRQTERWLPTASETTEGLDLDNDSVVLAVGGARGITRVLTEAIAERWRPHLWIIGSTRPDDFSAAELSGPLPSKRQYIADQVAEQPGAPVKTITAHYDALLRAREVHETLESFRRLCGEDRLHYLPCDITDRPAVTDAVNRLISWHGHVDLVLQGAGISRSGRLANKALSEFTRVRDVVVQGHRNLVDALASTRPRRWLNVGSFVGLGGAPGEIDYASAHGYLLTSAEHIRAQRGWSMTTIAWPFWTDVGIAASPIHRKAQERRGIFTGIDNREGAALLMAELRTSGDDPIAVLAGDAELQSSRTGWRPSAERSQRCAAPRTMQDQETDRARDNAKAS
ncbi:SDR family NAD(P)-dependent oxidoreductase [Streptomyces sp. cg35]|uniref:SDR family NAD(P)-dependent oxidoreductase n=1 Tax=Streptomyces sp. cg35 TaxID=3421650 RepID=UPI003D169A89